MLARFARCFGATVVLTLLAPISQAQITHWISLLDGSQVVPPVPTAGSGFASFVLEPGNVEIGVRVVSTGLSTPSSDWHLHGPASAGQNAPVVFPVACCLGTCGLDFLEPSLNATITGGASYVDVHTPAFPGGEIRGQVVAAPSLGTAFCFGDGTDGPCPCANAGAAGRGCENSGSTGGGRLVASGLTQPDLVVLVGSGLPVSSLVIFLQGDTTSPAVPFGDGLRCVAGTLLRLDGEVPFQGWVSYPHGCDATIQARSAQLGQPIPAGSTRSYQLWYRDASAAFCPPPSGQSWNVTNGISIAW